MTQTALKLVIIIVVVLLAAEIGKKSPSLAGVIATMPTVALFVFIFLEFDGADNNMLIKYCKGVSLGIFPFLSFFITAYFCLKSELPFYSVIVLSFSVWLISASSLYLFMHNVLKI